MKAEKILEIINKIELNTEDRRYFESVKTFDSKELRKYPTAMNVIELLRREAETEIRTATAKAAGDGEKLKIAENIVKRFKAYTSASTHRPAEAADAYRDESGRVIIADCYSAARLNEQIAGLNARAERHPLGYDTFEKALSACETRTADALPLPALSELTANIKLEKAERKAKKSRCGFIVHDFGDGFPACDAEKLRELLVLLTDKKRGIYPAATGAGERGNIYIKSELGDAILCPVKKAAKETA